MDTPDPEETGSWLQRRGTDLAVWGPVILAILGFAAGAAWLLTNARLSLREATPADTPRSEKSPVAAPPVRAPIAPAPTVAGASDPAWRVHPAPEFPARAMAAGVPEAVVRLTCEAGVSGRLSQCRILSETPAGYDFGANAVRAAEDARIRPRQIDGVAVSSRISFSVRYRLEP